MSHSVPWIVGIFVVLTVVGTLLLRFIARGGREDATGPSPSAAPGLKLPIASQEVAGHRILSLLGESQSALLYAGTTPAGQPCTIKLPNRTCLSQPDEVKRFMREEQLLDTIRHPNVVRKLAAGTVDDRGRKVPYLVLEPLGGQNFSEYLADKAPVEPGAAMQILTQLAGALEAVHEKGVVHRNLNPDAIRILPDGRVMLYNFGVARAVTMETITMHGQIVGTVEYIAPEQLYGRNVDERCDMYAMGVLAYQLVTGKSPFVYANIASLVKQKNESEGPHPHKDNPQVPAELDALVSTLMSRDPARRPAAAADLRDALAQMG